MSQAGLSWADLPSIRDGRASAPPLQLQYATPDTSITVAGRDVAAQSPPSQAGTA